MEITPLPSWYKEVLQSHQCMCSNYICKRCRYISHINRIMETEDLEEKADRYESMIMEHLPRVEEIKQEEMEVIPVDLPQEIPRLLVNFVTLTHQAYQSDRRQEPMFRDRIGHMVRQRSYPIVQSYGVLAHTAKGVLHVHIILVHQLRKLRNGKYDYPKPSFYQRYNQGERVDTKRVNSLSGLECCCKYMEDQSHDTVDSLKFLGDKKKFLEYIENNKHYIWSSQNQVSGVVESVQDFV